MIVPDVYRSSRDRQLFFKQDIISQLPKKTAKISFMNLLVEANIRERVHLFFSTTENWHGCLECRNFRTGVINCYSMTR